MICMGTSPKGRLYWENCPAKLEEPVFPPVQGSLQHLVRAPSRYLCLEKDRGSAEELQRRQRVAAGALLHEDRGNGEEPLLWSSECQDSKDRVERAGSRFPRHKDRAPSRTAGPLQPRDPPAPPSPRVRGPPWVFPSAPSPPPEPQALAPQGRGGPVPTSPCPPWLCCLLFC